MDVGGYLDRIGFDGKPTADLATLVKLHRLHLFSIPFENLSIHSDESIRLDLAWLYDKVVVRRRGGFCYELNGLFGWLLGEIGFDVSMLSAGVANKEGVFGPEFDHMALRVDLDRPYLADVGFGASFLEPLILQPDVTQNEDFRIERDGDVYFMAGLEDGVWGRQYRFLMRPHELTAFEGMCHFHQTSSDSHFTRKMVCTLPVEEGRNTLSGMTMIKTRNGQRKETVIADESMRQELLKRYFGVVV